MPKGPTGKCLFKISPTRRLRVINGHDALIKYSSRKGDVTIRSDIVYEQLRGSSWVAAKVSVDSGGDGIRHDLRVWVPEFGRKGANEYLHRLAAWWNAGGEYGDHANQHADHTGRKWWTVRKSECEFVTPKENHARQVAAGLVGRGGPHQHLPKAAKAEPKAKKKATGKG